MLGHAIALVAAPPEKDTAPAASGLLLYREGQAIASVPWQGSFDTTKLHRIVEYRGFVIYDFHKREGRHQPIAAVAETVVENSRRLIDLRFPEKANAP